MTTDQEDKLNGPRAPKTAGVMLLLAGIFSFGITYPDLTKISLLVIFAILWEWIAALLAFTKKTQLAGTMNLFFLFLCGFLAFPAFKDIDNISIVNFGHFLLRGGMSFVIGFIAFLPLLPYDSHKETHSIN